MLINISLTRSYYFVFSISLFAAAIKTLHHHYTSIIKYHNIKMPATRFTKLALASIVAMAAGTNALLTNPIRTTISRDIKTPDPVPQSGIDEAVELMSTGRMYRYNVKDAASSTVSKCEVEIAAYTGHKYCIALNSCGSAIMLMMKCAGLQPGDEVLSNAFTFGAVPSAIEHAGGKVRAIHLVL